MGALLRWLLIAVAALLGLGVLLSVALLILIDPNDYRAEIAAAVTEQTGRELRLEGDLSLQTFPCCGIQLGSVALANPSDWDDPTFARFGSAGISVQLWPLLTRQELKVGRITLDGMFLRLVRQRDGRVNWEFADTENTSDNDTGDVETPRENALADLDIAGIEISNGRLEYIDEIADEKIVISDISLVAGAIRGGQPFRLEAALTADGLVPDLLLQLSTESQVTLNIEKLTVDIAQLALQADLSGAAVPGDAAEIRAALARVGNLGGDVVTADGLDARLTLADAAFQLTGSGSLTGDRPQFAGEIQAERFSPRELLTALGEEPPVTSDPEVLNRFELRGNWILDGDRAALENIQAQLDDTAIQGAFQVASIAEERLNLNVQLDKLNLDRYLAPVEDEADSDGAGSDDSLDLPTEQLRALKLTGTVGIGVLEFSGAQLSDININVAANNGLIRLHPLTGKLYGGAYAGDVRLDVRAEQPQLSVNEVLSDIQLAELLSDMADTENLVGRGNARITATARGGSVSELLANLEGDSALDLRDGLYRGVDIWHEIRKARAQLKRDPLPAAPENPQTELSEFGGTATFSGGQLVNRDFQARVPFMRLNGSGSINLLESTLDYSLQARVTETPTFADGEDLDNLTGLTLPIRLKGSFDAPSVSVDVAALATGVAGQKLRDRLIKELEPDETETDSAETEPEKPRDALKRELRDLLQR